MNREQPTAMALIRLDEVVRRVVPAEPTPVTDVIERVVTECPIDREHIVAAIWDLVEDGDLAYDASARVRRLAAVVADPAEWSCRNCGATGSLSDSVTHRCVVALVAADPPTPPDRRQR